MRIIDKTLSATAHTIAWVLNIVAVWATSRRRKP